MILIVKKDGESLVLKERIVNDDGSTKEVDFNYIDYINFYLSNKDGNITFDFSDDIDEETRNKIISIQNEIKKIIGDSNKWKYLVRCFSNLFLDTDRYFFVVH